MGECYAFAHIKESKCESDTQRVCSGSQGFISAIEVVKEKDIKDDLM